MTFKEYKKHYSKSIDSFHLSIPSENITDLEGIDEFINLKT